MYNTANFTRENESSNNDDNNDGDDKDDNVHFVDRFSSVPVELDENEINLYSPPQSRRGSVICALRWVILSIWYALNWMCTIIVYICHWCIRAISRIRRSRNVAIDRNTMLFALDVQEDETTEKAGSVVDVDNNAFVSTSQDNKVKQINNTNKTNIETETSVNIDINGRNTDSSAHKLVTQELASSMNGATSALLNRVICKSNQANASHTTAHKSDSVKDATHIIDMDALFGEVNNESTHSKNNTNHKEEADCKSERIEIKSLTVDGSKKANITTLPIVGRSSALTSFSLIRELESRRKPLQHIDQLNTFLQEWNRYLPITLHVSIVNHHDDACNHEQHPLKIVAQTNSFGSATNHVLNDAHAIEKEKSVRLPVQFMLHLIGPIRASRTADILSVVEDVLLEDCDVNFLKLTAVHCSDLPFTSPEGANMTNIGEIEYSSMLNTHDAVSIIVNADNTKTVNNILSTDVNHSSKEDVQNDKLTILPSSTVVGEAEQMKLLRNAHYRVRVFAKNVLDSTFDECTSLTMTRCTCDPSDFGDAIPLNLCALEELRFVHCPLSSAHVNSLLQLAIHQTMTTSTSHAYRLNRQLNYVDEHYNLINGNQASTNDNNNDNGNNVSEGHIIAFGKLVSLQLSGAITTEAVMDLLNYFDEELTQCSSLRLLQIPSVLVRAARAHHFVQSHPLVQVKAN